MIIGFRAGHFACPPARPPNCPGERIPMLDDDVYDDVESPAVSAAPLACG